MLWSCIWGMSIFAFLLTSYQWYCNRSPFHSSTSKKDWEAFGGVDAEPGGIIFHNCFWYSHFNCQAAAPWKIWVTQEKCTPATKLHQALPTSTELYWLWSSSVWLGRAQSQRSSVELGGAQWGLVGLCRTQWRSIGPSVNGTWWSSVGLGKPL